MASVNEVINPKVPVEIDAVTTKLGEAIGEVIKLGEASQNVTFNIKGIDNLLVFSELMKKAEMTVNSAADALGNMKQATIDLNTAETAYGAKVSELILKHAELRGQMDANNSAIKGHRADFDAASDSLIRMGKAGSSNAQILDALNKRIADSRESIKTLTVDTVKLQSELSAVNPELQAAAQGFRSQSSSVNELDARLKLLTATYDKMNVTQQKSADGIDIKKRMVDTEKQLTAAYVEMNIKINENNRILKLNAVINDEAAGQRQKAIAQVKLWKMQLDGLADAEGAESEILREKINEQERFIKATSVQSAQQKLTVGDYKNARDEMSLTREALMEMTVAGEQQSEKFKQLTARLAELINAQKEVVSTANDAAAALRGEATAAEKAAAADQAAYDKMILGAQRSEIKQVESATRKSASEQKAAERMILAAQKAEIAQVNAATKSATAAEKAAARSSDVWGQFANIFERMGLRMVASLIWWTAIIGAATALYEWWTKISDAQQAAKENLDAYNNSIKEAAKDTAAMGNTINAGANSEAADIDTLATQLRFAKSIEARVDAYNKLAQIMPGVLRGYTQEDVLAGKATEAINNHIDKISRLKSEITETQKEYARQNSLFEQTKEKVQDLKKEYGDKWKESAGDTLKNFNDQLNATTNAKILLDEKRRQLAEFSAPDIKEKERPGYRASNPIKEENLTAVYDLEKQRLSQQAEIQKEIAGNEKESLDKRLEANANYYRAQYNLAELEEQKEQFLADTKISNAIQKQEQYKAKLVEVQNKNKYKGAEKDKEISTLKLNISEEEKVIQDGLVRKKAVLEKYYYSLEVLATKNKEAIAGIYISDEKDWLQREKLAFSQSVSNEVDAYLNKEMALKRSLDEKKISVAEYNKEIKKIQDESDEYLTKKSLEFYEGLLRADRLTVEQAKHVQDEINRLKEHTVRNADENKEQRYESNITDPIASLFASDKLKGDLDKYHRYLDEFYSKSVELAQSAEQAMNTIRNNGFAAQEQQLQILSQKYALQNQQKVAAINASTNYQITKDNQLSKQAAQYASQQNELQQQENQLAIKKAKGDKEAAEMSIITSTAAGIAKVWKDWGSQPEVAIPLTAVIAATGAAQYAAAASAPLPQYWQGGVTHTPLFIAGERGTELIQPIDGPAYLSSGSAAIYHEKPGATITPHDQTMKLIQYAAMGVNQPLPAGMTSHSGGDTMKGFADIVSKEFDRSMYELGYVLSRGKQPIQKQPDFKEAVRELNKSTAYKLK
jgi:hypothetical protein